MKKVLLIVVGSFAVFAVAGLYMTFVFQTLWNWFVVSALHLPQIGFWAAYGIFLVVGIFRATPKVDKDADMATGFGLLIGSLVGVTLTLGIGWLVHGLAQ